eukprot:TRINITY_DN47069_c0_g1_i1.p1 TRINITY_DN47069_c0_g1~~TRINITY_DN47069_c0_g1_i1.p1  ORF type:complete len:249 (+),score=67.40 TRINITY_DN47069_c0_g1_i1:65-748(+)
MCFIAATLKGVVTAERVKLLLEECHRLRAVGANVFHSTERHTAYLRPPDVGDDEGSVRRLWLESEKLLIAGDRLERGSVLPKIYAECKPLVEAALGMELHAHGDVMNRHYYNIYQKGHKLEWHFDNSAFGVNILLQEAGSGGRLVYGSGTSKAPGGEARVADFVAGREQGSDVGLLPGDVVVFRGQHILHAVTEVQQGERINAILCYGTVPDERLHPDTLRQFFGRS